MGISVFPHPLLDCQFAIVEHDSSTVEHYTLIRGNLCLNPLWYRFETWTFLFLLQRNQVGLHRDKHVCQGSKFVVAMVANATMFSHLLP